MKNGPCQGNGLPGIGRLVSCMDVYGSVYFVAKGCVLSGEKCSSTDKSVYFVLPSQATPVRTIYREFRIHQTCIKFLGHSLLNPRLFNSRVVHEERTIFFTIPFSIFILIPPPVSSRSYNKLLNSLTEYRYSLSSIA